MTDWSPLAGYRDKLDMLDADIMRLFGQRYALRREVMALKAQHDLPVEDKARVEDVIMKAKENAKKNDVPTDFAEALYRLVIDYSHAFETGKKHDHQED